MFAEHALPVALSIARQVGAAVNLVRVHMLYAMEEPEARWLPFDTIEDAKIEEHEQAYLAAIAKRLETVPSLPVTSAVVNGSIVESILEHARASNADLIVMTTHGHGPLSRFWLGSVADQLVRHTPLPVLLIRPQETQTELQGAPTSRTDPTTSQTACRGEDILAQQPKLGSAPRRILIPLDGSELAERVLEPVIALGDAVETQYRLVRVVQPPLLPDASAVPTEHAGSAHATFEKRKAEAEAYLAAVAERLRAKNLRVDTQIVVGKRAADAILDVARDQGYDLIAIATHGRGGFKRLLLGSVADKVFRGTFTPLLLYRPMDRHGPPAT